MSSGSSTGAGKRRMRPEQPTAVPKWRWALWWTILGAAVFIFYVLLTPIWLGLRALAWAGRVALAPLEGQVTVCYLAASSSHRSTSRGERRRTTLYGASSLG